MARKNFYTEPVAVNEVIGKKIQTDILEVASTNEFKLAEFNRILKDKEILPLSLDVEEVQSIDPIKVASEKAKLAWKENKFHPVVVEDTSLLIKALDDRPGPFVNFFATEVSMRKMICEKWIPDDEDRSAVAMVIIAIYDGKEVHLRVGKTEGKISKKLRGTNGFGWDDMFIPTSPQNKLEKTFAEMEDKEKDKYSMRGKALQALKDKPFETKQVILMLPEPYQQELERINIEKLKKEKKAIDFAYRLECLDNNKKSNTLDAFDYRPILKKENKFYTRFTQTDESKSLGLILTDVDRDRLNLYKNGEPVMWQMGPERRKLALAQRVEFFMENQNKNIHQNLNRIEKNGVQPRTNKRSETVEQAIQMLSHDLVIGTRALKEIGYNKISSDKLVSRTSIAESGLYNTIGKHARSIYGVGSMPAVSGWRDVIVTTVLNHSMIFVHRNSIHAGYLDRQIDLINSARNVIKKLKLSSSSVKRANANIGAAIGVGDVKQVVRDAKKLHKKAGVTLFRIYTINSDPRVVETAKELRAALGDKIELFIGQIADKNQALEFIGDDIKADGLIFGHGGGRQCTSAANGMAVTTLEDIYSIVTDSRFNKVSLLAEGGVGKSVGPMFLLGLDGILYNQQLTHGTIETGDIFFEHENGKPCQPYHGSASSPTMIIEAENKNMLESKVRLSGRVRNVEGKAGYVFYEEKANSMVFFINQFKHYAARTLADLGVSSIEELREFLHVYQGELLRLVSDEAKYIGEAYKVKV